MRNDGYLPVDWDGDDIAPGDASLEVQDHDGAWRTVLIGDADLVLMMRDDLAEAGVTTCLTRGEEG